MPNKVRHVGHLQDVMQRSFVGVSDPAISRAENPIGCVTIRRPDILAAGMQLMHQRRAL